MPRTADHDLRRRQIADAVCALIAERGLDAVTVAGTAARAGISVGLVQHYFRAKDDMLLHAFRTVTARIRDRADRHRRAGTAHRSPISAVLLAALAETIPFDGERRTEFRVARAFAGRALDNPRLAEVDTATADALRADIAGAVDNGRECGEVGPGIDTETAAVRLAAVTEGLALRVYRGADAPGLREAVDAVLRAELAAVFSGTCRQYEP